MEIKLYVMTHKEKVGSMIYATSNMSDHEIEIIESSTSRRNKSSEYELKEKNNGGYWVYFFAYKGGKDEFGREYQEIIASIFTYRLTITEGEKLRKIFYRIKNEIANKSFSIEKSKFVGIKRRDGEDRFRQNRINQWKKHVKFAVITFIMIVSAVVLYKYAKENPEQFKIISQMKNYGAKRGKISISKKEIYKYRENIKIIGNEVYYATNYLNNSKSELTPEFYEKLREKNMELLEFVGELQTELNNTEMAGKLTADELKENRSYVQIEKEVQEYNNNFKSENLKKIKMLCQDYLKNYSTFKSIKVKYYLGKADKILDGEKSVNVGVDIFTKGNSKLLWKKVELEILPQNKVIKREIEGEEGKKVSKVKLELKYEDSVSINLYIVDKDNEDKKLVASFGIKIEDMNRLEKIRVGEYEFYLKFIPDYSEFIL